METITDTASTDHDAVMTQQPPTIDPDLSSTICNAMASAVQSSLEAGISKLPFLSKQQELIAALNRIYLKNIDILERYLDKNLFCCDDDEISKKYLLHPPPHQHDNNNNNNNKSSSNDDDDETSDSIITTFSKIVSVQELQELKAAVEQLRTKKDHLTEKRQQCTAHVSCLQAATSLLSFQDTALPAVTDTTTTALNQIQEHAKLQQAARQGKELYQQLTVENKNPQETHNEEEEDVDMIDLTSAPANKASTVEERFQQRQQPQYRVSGNRKMFDDILKLLRDSSP